MNIDTTHHYKNQIKTIWMKKPDPQTLRDASISTYAYTLEINEEIGSHRKLEPKDDL